jgi:hypothetical protein
LNGIRPAVIYMMFFPLGYLQMESTEDMVHPGWNQDLTPITAVMDEMGICIKYFHSSFDNNI